MRGVGVCETVFGYTKLTAMAEEKKKESLQSWWMTFVI